MKLSVIVHPNSKKPRIEKDMLGTLHVYVSEPPLEGRANGATVAALAAHFKVKKNSIFIVNGGKTKNKTIEVIQSGCG